MAFTDNVAVRECYAPPQLAEPVLLAAACHQGDLLAYSGGWILATTAYDTIALVALEAGASGANVMASPIARVRGFTGGTPGAAVYATDTGGYTTTAPPTPRRVGRMTTDHSAVINLSIAATIGTI